MSQWKTLEDRIKYIKIRHIHPQKPWSSTSRMQKIEVPLSKKNPSNSQAPAWRLGGGNAGASSSHSLMASWKELQEVFLGRSTTGIFWWVIKMASQEIPSGKLSHNYGKIHHFLMGKSTIHGYFHGNIWRYHGRYHGNIMGYHWMQKMAVILGSSP